MTNNTGTPLDNSVSARVTRAIADQLGLNDSAVTPEKNIADDLGADSLDQIELIMALEEEFEMEVSDDDAFAAQTVQQAIDLVTRLQP